MSYSYQPHTTSASQLTYTFSFAGVDPGYISGSHISVEVRDSGESEFATLDTSKWYLSGTNQITLTSSIAAPADGKNNLRIRRIVPKDNPYATFPRGSMLDMLSLDRTFIQMLEAFQEFLDGFLPAGFYFQQNINMNGHKFTNLGVGTESGDSINWDQWDDHEQRITALETDLTALTSRTIPYYYIATGGETRWVPGPWKFTSALMFIDGAFQNQNLGAFSITENGFNFAEPLIKGQEVYVLLGSHVSDPDNHPTFSEMAAESARIMAVFADGTGSSKVGYTLSPGVYQTVFSKLSRVLDVRDFGAVGDGLADDAYAFQKAALYAHSVGGARIFVPVPPVEYRLTYPVFLYSNTEFFGAGRASRVVFENPTFSKGRGGFVMGSSREANRDLALAAYAAGTFPGATTNSTTYTNPALLQYLRDNPSFIETQNSSIHDLHIVAKYTGTTLNGGYGINMVNAAHCDAYNISGEGWTQVIGMGSDSAPETPSTYNCRIWNISADLPNQDKTFYSVAFVANSTNFLIRDVKQLKPMLAGTLNGSAIATNAVEDGIIDGVYIPDLGRTVSSEGILVNNAKGVKVSNVNIGNARSAVSFYYTIASFNDATKPNTLDGLTTTGCDYSLSLRSKYVMASNVKSQNLQISEVYFANSNASDNVLNFTPVSMAFSTAASAANFLQNNTVKGWRTRYTYLRPVEILNNDKTDINSYSANSVATKAGVNLKFQWKIPDYMKAIVDCRMFLTFNAGALTAGSNMSISLRRRVAFDGNTTTAPYVELTNSRTATQDTLQDTNLVTQAGSSGTGYILNDDTTHGLPRSLDLYIEANSNVVNSTVKEVRVQYFGD